MAFCPLSRPNNPHNRFENMPRKIKPTEKPLPPPLVVSPKQAQALLGIGRTYLYQLLEEGRLDFYKEGVLTRITLDSIHRHIAARLAEGGGRKGICNANRKA
jgi:excisionase family DNA binding protein